MKDVIIPNVERFEELKKQISKDGEDKLHILSDFDRTLTRAFYKSKKASSIISKLRNGNYLTKDYAERAHSLYDKYHPMEIDNSLDKRIRDEQMQEWWKAHMELLIECEFDMDTLKKCVKDMIKEDTLEFRDGAKELLELLDKKNVPLIIISSSLGDLIKEYLREKKVFYDNINVIGNTFIFDKNGKAANYEKVIHVFNKHEFELHNLPIYSELLKRKNVILIGDSIGDLGMIEGFPYSNLIKIGFLNEEIEKNLEEYKKHFDVILLNDTDMSYVNELLKEII